MKTRPFPPALPHGPIEEILPDLFQVTGTCRMAGPVPLRFSRVMTVWKRADGLVVFNSVRLGEEGERALDLLGPVRLIVRLAGNHGSDDPYYRDRYKAPLWAPSGAPYIPGFDTRAEPYCEPDHWFLGGETLPLPGVVVHHFGSKPAEAIAVLPIHGGVAVVGDSLQNWAAPDPYFNWIARISMRGMGFFRPYNVGPGWLRQCRPPERDLRAVLDLPFRHALLAHGAPVIDDAQERYRASIEFAAGVAAKSV